MKKVGLISDLDASIEVSHESQQDPNWCKTQEVSPTPKHLAVHALMLVPCTRVTHIGHCCTGHIDSCYSRSLILCQLQHTLNCMLGGAYAHCRTLLVHDLIMVRFHNEHLAEGAEEGPKKKIAREEAQYSIVAQHHMRPYLAPCGHVSNGVKSRAQTVTCVRTALQTIMSLVYHHVVTCSYHIDPLSDPWLRVDKPT